VPKTYTQADEKMKYTVVRNGCALTAESKGSVSAGIRSAFGWLSPERRELLLCKLQADHEAELTKEAARAVAAKD